MVKDIIETEFRFNMNSLTVLFGGMALERFGMNLTRIVLPAMDKFQGMNHKGVKAMNSMNASLQFLKFSLFDTFSQTPLFRQFVETVIKLSDGLAMLAQNNPALTTMVFSLGAIATILGASLIAGSWIYQIGSAVVVASQAIIGAFAEGGTAYAALKGFRKLAATEFGQALTLTVGLTFVILSLGDFLSMFKDSKTDVLERLIASFKLTSGLAMIGWVVGGPGGALLGASIGIGISLMINAIDWVLEEGNARQAAANLETTLKKNKILEGVIGGNPFTANVEGLGGGVVGTLNALGGISDSYNKARKMKSQLQQAQKLRLDVEINYTEKNQPTTLSNLLGKQRVSSVTPRDD